MTLWGSHLCEVARPRNKGKREGSTRHRQRPNSHAYSYFFQGLPRLTHPSIPPSSLPLCILCYPLQVALELITYYKSYHGLTLCLAYNLPRNDLFPLCLRSALKVKFKMCRKLSGHVFECHLQTKLISWQLNWFRDFWPILFSGFLIF